MSAAQSSAPETQMLVIELREQPWHVSLILDLVQACGDELGLIIVAVVGRSEHTRLTRELDAHPAGRRILVTDYIAEARAALDNRAKLLCELSDRVSAFKTFGQQSVLTFDGRSSACATDLCRKLRGSLQPF